MRVISLRQTEKERERKRSRDKEIEFQRLIRLKDCPKWHPIFDKSSALFRIYGAVWDLDNNSTTLRLFITL